MCATYSFSFSARCFFLTPVKAAGDRAQLRISSLWCHEDWSKWQQMAQVTSDNIRADEKSFAMFPPKPSTGEPGPWCKARQASKRGPDVPVPCMHDDCWASWWFSTWEPEIWFVTKGSVSYLSSPCFSTSLGGIGGPAHGIHGILAVMYWISIIRGEGASPPENGHGFNSHGWRGHGPPH